MNDRELLELAAKAAGYNIDHPWNRDRLNMMPPVISLVAHNSNGDLVNTAWNPLANDGDALRLAVRLAISIERRSYGPNTVWAGAMNAELTFFEALDDDSAAATRRAIVRAAAEIGRSMQ